MNKPQEFTPAVANADAPVPSKLYKAIKYSGCALLAAGVIGAVWFFLKKNPAV